MLRINIIAATLMLCALYAPPAISAPETDIHVNAQTLTPAQAEAVNGLIHDYLLSHPEIVSEAITKAEAAEKANVAAAAKTGIASHQAELYRDPDSPSLGNPQGDIVLVEFFDYRCPYCKVVEPILMQQIAKQPRLRVVMKEFPILSPESELAARAALVAARHGKYAELHHALFQVKGKLDSDSILKAAISVGLDESKLRTEITAAWITQALEKNQNLAKAIGVEATPTFVAGDTTSPGAVDLKGFQDLIAMAAKSPIH